MLFNPKLNQILGRRNESEMQFKISTPMQCSIFLKKESFLGKRYRRLVGGTHTSFHPVSSWASSAVSN